MASIAAVPITPERLDNETRLRSDHEVNPAQEHNTLTITGKKRNKTKKTKKKSKPSGIVWPDAASSGPVMEGEIVIGGERNVMQDDPSGDEGFLSDKHMPETCETGPSIDSSIGSSTTQPAEPLDRSAAILGKGWHIVRRGKQAKDGGRPEKRTQGISDNLLKWQKALYFLTPALTSLSQCLKRPVLRIMMRRNPHDRTVGRTQKTSFIQQLLQI